MEFQKCFPELNGAKAETCDTDPPDGFLTHNGKKIAVELTELIWDNDSNGRSKKAQESLAEYIVSIAEEKYSKRALPVLYTSISFVDNYGLNKHSSDLALLSQDKDLLSDYLVEKIIQHIPDEPDQLIQIPDYNEFGDRLLHQKIESIWIGKYSSLDKNCWTTSGGGCIPDITTDKLKAYITKKNKGLTKYKANYDEAWLVLIEYWSDLSGYFSFRDIDEILKTRFDSGFDRIFIFRSRRNEIIELSLLKNIEGGKPLDSI
jgi:hypothetical protein